MGTKIKNSAPAIVGIKPSALKNVGEKIIKIENMSTEVEIPMKKYTYDHLKKAKGGSVKKKKKFPDLSGDGKVTKKDILMARGVIKKPKKKKTK